MEPSHYGWKWTPLPLWDTDLGHGNGVLVVDSTSNMGRQSGTPKLSTGGDFLLGDFGCIVDRVIGRLVYMG